MDDDARDTTTQAASHELTHETVHESTYESTYDVMHETVEERRTEATAATTAREAWAQGYAQVPPSPFEQRLQEFLDAFTAEQMSTELLHREPARIDVTWSTHDTPVGTLLLALHHDHLVRVAFESEGFDDVIDTIGELLGGRTLHTPAPADRVRHQLDEYFDGERTTFDVPFDLVLSRAPFRRLVQNHLPEIPYATTASYGAVAEDVGRPRAVRAVGSACAHNPLPVVLPCHRVVRSDGSFGHYLGGSEAKSYLLDHERAHASDVVVTA